MTESPTSQRRSWERPARRLMHLYWRFSRGLTLGVRGMVFDQHGRILLIKHSYVAGWHLPGGGVEVGETLLEALARELREEANVELTDVPPLHGMFFNERVSRRDHVAVYVVRAFRQDSPPVPNREIIDHGFFDPAALPAETGASTRARLAEILDGQPVSERW